ncbi:MAG TPA: amidohydrolase, partial [Caulobacter sp.]|nr:amidohydrolase [Caulobacter sp.]
MLIDAHCHVWRLGENDHAWPTPDLATIYRDFDLKDLAEASVSSRLSGSVLVQSQPSRRDTEWLLRV